MLEAHNIRKTIDGKAVLHEVSLRVTPGQTLAILGPSGSGKTSLLRALLGLEAPDAGTVLWDGKTLSNNKQILVRPEQRSFGLVFQDAALFPHLNVRENIAFGLHHLSAQQRRNQIEEWIFRLGLKDIDRRDVNTLSGGERQKVALARTLATQPRAILLDEPFSAVDRLGRLSLIESLQTLFKETRVAACLVTHDARDALELAHELLMLRQGKVVRQGPVSKVIENPGDEWVHAFLECGVAKRDSRAQTYGQALSSIPITLNRSA